ncbi:hypothetical protein Tco_0732579, partial [Tanacetum coccineum]
AIFGIKRICDFSHINTGVLNGDEVFQEPIVNTATKSSIPVSAVEPVTTADEAKDKGKEKMIEPKKPLKKKDQIAFNEEVARNLEARLQAELEEEERLSRQKGRRSQHSFN